MNEEEMNAEYVGFETKRAAIADQNAARITELTNLGAGIDPATRFQMQLNAILTTIVYATGAPAHLILSYYNLQCEQFMYDILAQINMDELRKESTRLKLMQGLRGPGPSI